MINHAVKLTLNYQVDACCEFSKPTADSDYLKSPFQRKVHAVFAASSIFYFFLSVYLPPHWNYHNHWFSIGVVQWSCWYCVFCIVLIYLRKNIVTPCCCKLLWYSLSILPS